MNSTTKVLVDLLSLKNQIFYGIEALRNHLEFYVDYSSSHYQEMIGAGLQALICKVEYEFETLRDQNEQSNEDDTNFKSVELEKAKLLLQLQNLSFCVSTQLKKLS